MGPIAPGAHHRAAFDGRGEAMGSVFSLGGVRAVSPERARALREQ